MKINILLPFKEKFDEHRASSVSITISNNLYYTKYLDKIKIFGQQTETPLFNQNFIGSKNPYFSFKSKNRYLADQMCKYILNSADKKQILEIHNRPYLIDGIYKKLKSLPISLFLHNDPKFMQGTKSSSDRKKILKKCAAVFCVSEFVKNQFLDGIKNDKNKVFVLHNGVIRKLKKFPTKKKEIIFIGRLVPEKGVELYVDAMIQIAKKFPDWHFSLIGSHKLGDNSINKFGENVIKKFKNIGPQANFYGFRDYAFVQQRMKESAIIVIPSIWQEPFGLVAAEAMSNGIAIVASKVGGIPEIIRNNGILIDNINVKKIKQAIEELISDNKKRKLMQNRSWNNFIHSSQLSSKSLDDYRKVIFKNYFLDETQS